MKVPSSATKYSISVLLLACGLALVFSPLDAAQAQDSAFLACGQHSDRGQRISCLEDALEAAMAAQDARAVRAEPGPPAATVSPSVAATPLPAAPTAAPIAAPTAAAAPAAAPQQAEVPAAEEDSTSILERLRNFGQQTRASVSTDTDGKEQLQDTITKLEKRNDLWVVTLSSDQVWMQEYPRALNLREGDEITIYQAGIGNGYRLATKRLSGFIRVKRVR